MSRWPEPGWQVPRAIAFSPDGKSVIFLESEKHDDEMALFSMDRADARNVRVLVRASDLPTGKGPMSREEELRRERERKRDKGITSYVWAKRAPLLVVPFGGDVFARRGDESIVRLTETPEPEVDPRPCDSGERIAFVRKGELFAIDVATQKEIQLTRRAAPGVTRGLSDFNGQEEFGERHGHFWSPRCDRIVYVEVDEREVEEVPVFGYREAGGDLMMQRYPITGRKNPIVRIGVVDVASRKTTNVRLPGPGGEKYLGRFAWAPDARTFYFQMLSRDQKKLDLVRVDAATLEPKVIATESAPTWVEFSQLRVLERSPRLVWTTNRTGFRHIELLDATSGAHLADVTQGSWDVESIGGVDEEEGRVMFQARAPPLESPLEAHIYAASLSGASQPRCQNCAWPGIHDAVFDDSGKSWVDVFSAADVAPIAVRRDRSRESEVPSSLDPDFHTLGILPPKFVTIPGPGGETLHGSLLPPRTIIPSKRYPFVVLVYGGPGHQSVQNAWSPQLLAQHLADRGVGTFRLDNRGTPGRGRAFETATYGRLGELELADQLAGVDYLAKLPFVDANRIGIYGHSYGGFMTLLAMLRAPGRFAVGVAGSPVVDFSLYDSGYTERYMGTPAENPKGYAGTDLVPLAPNLRGKLLVIHALMDENVHFQNTARLIDAFAAAHKTFDLLVFPGERHGYRSPRAKEYAAERVIEYFARNL